VLDLAAGTGKLTRALLAVGLDVVAVEPLPRLCELLRSVVGAERRAREHRRGVAGLTAALGCRRRARRARAGTTAGKRPVGAERLRLAALAGNLL
jgi:hypothetical protein